MNSTFSKMKGRDAVLPVVVVLLFAALMYLAYSRYVEYWQAREFNIYRYGARAGYQQAVTELMQEAVKCQPVTIYYYNQTLDVIAVDCLRAPTMFVQDNSTQLLQETTSNETAG